MTAPRPDPTPADEARSVLDSLAHTERLARLHGFNATAEETGRMHALASQCPIGARLYRHWAAQFAERVAQHIGVAA